MAASLYNVMYVVHVSTVGTGKNFGLATTSEQKHTSAPTNAALSLSL